MTSAGASGLQLVGRSARLWRALISLATVPADGSRESIAASARAEDLVVEFDEAYTSFVEGFDDLPSESQLLALQAIDTKLAAMVRSKDAALWTLRACREDPIWREVQMLAEGALNAFDWPRPLV